MKKTFLSLLVVVFAGSINPTFGQIEVGGGLGFGTGIETLGINARGYYSLKDSPLGPGYIRFGPGFTFFLPRTTEVSVFGSTTKSTATWMEINLDGNYVIGETELKGYGLFGFNIGIRRWKTEGDSMFGISFSESESDTPMGINIGAGGIYELEKLSVFAELRYASNFDQAIIMAGVLFNIGN